MNPVVVIPSFWDADDSPRPLGQRGVYDHATPVDKPVPELETCLASLEQVRGIMRVIVLLVAPPAYECSARARVDGICRTHARLNPFVVGRREAELLQRAVSRVARDVGEMASLHGYGLIRNTGLLAATALGHDCVVFMDDDEVAVDPNFLIDAVYGLTMRAGDNTIICAKTGFFVNADDSPYASERVAWRDRAWSKHAGFNAWMRRALDPETPRVLRSNVCCGGCMALHASAFTLVPFDPWIPRGEDLDYMLNLRIQGMDLWFDSQWSVRRLPPSAQPLPARFLQDAYRWIYDARKVAHCNARIETSKVSPEALRPYPGPWLTDDVTGRFRVTALRRALVCREHRDYLRVLRDVSGGASAYAEEHVREYLPFVARWRRVAATLWDDRDLADLLVGSGTPKAPTPRQTSSWMELGGGNLGGDL